jgi:hypothetical protein
MLTVTSGSEVASTGMEEGSGALEGRAGSEAREIAGVGCAGIACCPTRYAIAAAGGDHAGHEQGEGGPRQ